MAAGYAHPKVKVHVGDGFKFLDDYKNEFDVIITDSSDPEGPAESLFQKPYFQLLHGALREGGVITTQGCTSPYSGWSEGPEETIGRCRCSLDTGLPDSLPTVSPWDLPRRSSPRPPCCFFFFSWLGAIGLAVSSSPCLLR